MSSCFWCDSPGPTTRDHVVPRCAGGREHNNVVAACDRCQFERARVQSFYGFLRACDRRIAVWHRLRHRKRVSLRRSLKRARVKALPTVRLLALKWAAIETARWGWSPTACLDLTVPPIPQGKFRCPKPPPPSSP